MKSRSPLFGLLAGLFLATGLVFSTTLFTRAWIKIREDQAIVVTGSARKAIRSDLIVWRGSFTAEAPDLLDAQRKLKADVARVEQFLRARAVTNQTFGNIAIQEIRSTITAGEEVMQKRIGYRLTQTVEIRSPEVERIAALDRETPALVEQGVVFTVETPQFIYTKAGEAKVEMLAEATGDARARAEQIASQGGRQVKHLQSARMGVFQITPLYSTQTSWEGLNDTTSPDKSLTAIVTATFSLN